MDFFTSDLHLRHANIIRYCNRPFHTRDDMDTFITNKWNSVVSNNDTVFVLGDLILDYGRENIRKTLDGLNGKIILVLGDHDASALKYKERFLDIRSFIEYKRPGVSISLFHYPIARWRKSHYNSGHLYGHCLDSKTEILTNNGWKTRETLHGTDNVLTLNMGTHVLEYNCIDKIIDHDYCGDVYSLRSKSVDFRVTSQHVMIDVSRRKNTVYRKIYANELSAINRRTFIHSGICNEKHIQMNDIDIRLLVQIAADGSVCNTDLARIRVHKERKKNRVRSLLGSANILYTENLQRNGCTNFNFTIPKHLLQYSFKPIDRCIEKFNEHQLGVMLDEYVNTDGNKNGDTYMIYTSKVEEANSIQIACIKNGFMCNISCRANHGFSKRTSYTVSATQKQRVSCVVSNKNIQIENVLHEHFWCVSVPNRTIMIRRNGKPIIVGNCHGHFVNGGKSFDIGVDANGFRPLSLDEVMQKISQLPDNPNLIRRNQEQSTAYEQVEMDLTYTV